MRKLISSYLYIILLFAIAVLLSSCDSSVTNSDSSLSKSKTNGGEASINLEERANPEIMANFQQVGSADIDISNTGNPPGSGTVSVTYENEKVTINYYSYSSPQDVAHTLNYQINIDPDIDLTSTVSYSIPTVTITGHGTSGVAYVTHTNGTHITAFPYLAVL